MAQVICITGGIGAGKSVVSRVLRLKGYSVYDCDSEASRLMQELEEIRSALTERFGSECYLDGCLNRPYLASRIFTNEADRSWLNSLVHEEVRKDIDRVSAGSRLLFIESAIPVTSGLDLKCSEIWLVTAPDELRYHRAMQRGGEKDDVKRRILSQQHEFDSLPSEKVRLIDNDENCGLLPQIDSLLSGIVI